MKMPYFCPANLTFMKKLLFLAPVIATLCAFSTPTPPPTIPAEINALLSKYNCVSCHAMERKMIGPTWKDIAAKKYTKKQIVTFVYKPQPSNWPGYPAMAAQPSVPKADLNKIADWLITVK
jgi:cytochrome c